MFTGPIASSRAHLAIGGIGGGQFLARLAAPVSRRQSALRGSGPSSWVQVSAGCFVSLLVLAASALNSPRWSRSLLQHLAGGWTHLDGGQAGPYLLAFKRPVPARVIAPASRSLCQISGAVARVPGSPARAGLSRRRRLPSGSAANANAGSPRRPWTEYEPGKRQQRRRSSRPATRAMTSPAACAAVSRA